MSRPLGQERGPGCRRTRQLREPSALQVVRNLVGGSGGGGLEVSDQRLGPLEVAPHQQDLRLDRPQPQPSVRGCRPSEQTLRYLACEESVSRKVRECQPGLVRLGRDRAKDREPELRQSVSGGARGDRPDRVLPGAGSRLGRSQGVPSARVGVGNRSRRAVLARSIAVVNHSALADGSGIRGRSDSSFGL